MQVTLLGRRDVFTSFCLSVCRSVHSIVTSQCYCIVTTDIASKLLT